MSTGSELQLKGTRLFEKGSYEEAAAIFVQAIEAYRAESNLQLVAEMEVNVGLCKRETGQYEEAIKHMQTGLAYFEERGPRARKAQTLGNMALAYAKLEDTEQAQTLYREAASIFREIGEDEYYGETILALADMYFRAGDLMLAASTYEIGLDYIRNKNHRQKMLKQLMIVKNRMAGEKKQEEARDSSEVASDSRRRRRRGILGRKQETDKDEGVEEAQESQE
jgi:tetratricopeptide (TPR) repeat protein